MFTQHNKKYKNVTFISTYNIELNMYIIILIKTILLMFHKYKYNMLNRKNVASQVL